MTAVQSTNGVIDFNYQIIRKPNRKTSTIVIKDNNDIEVRVPARMPTRIIEQFIEQKQQWIKKKLRFNSEQRAPVVVRSFTDGERFDLLGEPLILTLQQGSRSTVIEDGKLLLTLPDPEPDKVRRQLIHWYRLQAKSYFTERCKIRSKEVGAEASHVGEKAYKSRWGSCHIDGRIYFNWRLIMAPVWVIDYVIIHELCHLIHHNHSRDYWQLVESVMPDYRHAKNWLKINGNSLLFS